MEEFSDKMPLGDVDFGSIITEEGAPYVDKTGFLAHIIRRNGRAWYLARPRRFGKTLTVSTLEYLFSGNKDLFKGLAIEKYLGEAKFAPRPVLRLDMSAMKTAAGLPGFTESLAKYTRGRARLLGLDLPPGQSGDDNLNDIIEELGLRSSNGIAVLIDEYDAPLTKFMAKPHLLEELRGILTDFYLKLKVMAEHVSFLFATGIGRNSHLGLFSSVNHITDLTIDTEYGAVMGFTHEELQRYFDPQLEESARSLQITKTELLEKMKSYYNGFSFDGETLVYNPYSTLKFFSKQKKHFSNYWFNTGTTKVLYDYMSDKHLAVDQFSGVIVPLSFAELPLPLDVADPKSFLYQSGYLSLRLASVPTEGQAVPGGPDSGELDVFPPVESDGVKVRGFSTDDELFMLDYPNIEVRSSMSMLMLSSILGKTTEGIEFIHNTETAAQNLNPELLVEQFNMLLSRAPYERYKTNLSSKIKKDATEIDPDEGSFRSLLLGMCWALKLEPFAESRLGIGRSDLVFSHNGRYWVIELKISKNTVLDDRVKATEALNQILDRDYAGSFVNPILLGLAVNKRKKKVITWVKRIGLKGEDVWTFPDPPQSAKAPPRTPKPKAPPKKPSGPRM